MAGTNLGFPYDSEIFNYQWDSTPDLILTSMIESGAVVRDAEIERLIANGSNFFTVPYYDVLGGTEDIYNGVDGFTGDTLTGGTYGGCVYGRMSKWYAKSFIKDFNSGADPMAQIVDGVAQFYIKARQNRILGILNAIFGVTDSDFASHITDLAGVGTAQSEKATVTAGATASGNLTVTVTSAGMTGSPKAVTVAVTTGDDTVGEVATAIKTALGLDSAIAGKFTISGTGAEVILANKTIESFDDTLAIAVAVAATGVTVGASVDNTVASTITDANLIGETTINDACVKACGDNAQDFRLAIMHSTVANRLANLQLLNYSKYTDASGITRDLPIATINGKTVIVTDVAPSIDSPVDGYKEYTTYILGMGAIRYAKAPVDVPSEMDRNPETNGGMDMIYTRIRECITAYGFSFKGDVTTNVGVPDAVLFNSANWERKMPAKAVMMAKVVTNG